MVALCLALPCFALLRLDMVSKRFRALGAKHEELESLRSGTEVLVLVLVISCHQVRPKLDASHVGFFPTNFFKML